MTEIPDSNATAELQREEERVEARSGVFKKELGLADLALTQILFIIGLPWIGVAAKQGPSHVVLWLLAMLFFYIPSAAVVIYLNRIMPLEGGLYQWAKLGFNEGLGFLVAWNLWLFAILNTSEIGLQVTQYLRYILGPSSEGLTGSKWFIGLVSMALIGGLVLLTTVGLGVGKWVHKAGGALMLATFFAILILPWLNLAHGTLPAFHPLRIEMPVLSIMSLNLLGKMGFGALGGFEYVAIHAGECRDPVRTITRSVWLAAPIIAGMFILGTSSVLALIPQDRIDLIAPIPQVLSEGFHSLNLVLPIATTTILALLCIRIAQSSVMFGGNTRLPMVAGWDRLLPELVHAAARPLPHPGQLDPLRGRRHAGPRARGPGRRRQAGSLPVALERLGSLLRPHLPRDVRPPPPRPPRHPAPAPPLAESLRPLRPADDGALRGAVDRADHPGGEPDDVRGEDRRVDRDYECFGVGDLPCGGEKASPS